MPYPRGFAKLEVSRALGQTASRVDIIYFRYLNQERGGAAKLLDTRRVRIFLVSRTRKDQDMGLQLAGRSS